MSWEMPIALGGLLVAVITALLAGRRDTRGDAAERAETKAMLSSIKGGVDDIRLEQRRMRDRADQQAKELAECMSSCRSAHKRIDEHERRLNQLQTHPPD